MSNKEILVFPRDCIHNLDRFIPWDDAKSIMRSALNSVTWLSRDKAEKSLDWIQPIPCSFIRNSVLKYFTFKRVDRGRDDLRARVSLVCGGHIDRPESYESISSLFRMTLIRELEEEVNVVHPKTLRQVGLIIDLSSIRSSRHIAFIYEVITDRRLKIQATEEFAAHSKRIRNFLDVNELSRFRDNFDPWSSILYEDFIAPSQQKIARQLEFPFYI